MGEWPAAAILCGLEAGARLCPQGFDSIPGRTAGQLPEGKEVKGMALYLILLQETCQYRLN